MRLIDADKLIEALGELDVYFDNDYWSNNREPMWLRKEVFEVIENMETSGD